MPYPHRYLELAWRHLLQNHPHDSICGCSIDQVHKDMEYRFDQSYGIASRVADDALQRIAERVQMPPLGDNEFAVVVFNPSTDPVDGPIDLTLHFPRNSISSIRSFSDSKGRSGSGFTRLTAGSCLTSTSITAASAPGFEDRCASFP